MSSEREAVVRRFLDQAGFAAARRTPLAGDASTRRYERLTLPAGGVAILMDQPPAAESTPCPPDAGPETRAALGYNALARLAAGRIEAFVGIGGWLRSLGLSAPEIIAAEPAAGLAVIEDLGDGLYARLLEAGEPEGPLYAAAADVLIRLHAETPPPKLGDWPLLSYDTLALRTGGELFVEWLPRFSPAFIFDETARAEWRALWAPILQRAEAAAGVFCHRDFHAENLLWLPDRSGVARVGLLDFQDAVLAHPAWDLSMLLHDARRDISADREEAVLAHYLAARPELDPSEFLADFHALGALNMARILGLFARLVVRDGKTRYGAFMPRLWGYLDRCLHPPAPTGLGAWLARHAPAEARV